MQPALVLAREIVAVAARHDDPIYRLVGYRQLATVQLYMGQFSEALDSLRTAEQYRDPARQKPLSYRFAVDPGLAVLCFKTWMLLFLGFPEQAARIRTQVQAELPGHGHAPTVAMCNFFAVAWPELMFGDRDAAERQCAELVAFCMESKAEHFRLLSAIIHGCAVAARRPTAEHIAAVRAAIDARLRSGSSTMDSSIKWQFAEVLLAARDFTGAEAVLQEALAFVEQTGERFWLSELHRLDGLIARGKPGPDYARAETSFRQAIDVARAQGARMLELRASTDLVRLWRDTGAAQRSPPAAGANPRRDRGRRDPAGRSRGAGTARRHRLIATRSRDGAVDRRSLALCPR